MLIRESNVTEKFIAQTLRVNGWRATIHREEDAILSRRGFAKKLPSSYWIQGSAYFLDPLARYKEVGLFEELVRRVDTTWYTNAD